jgi:hypothetical protein
MRTNYDWQKFYEAIRCLVSEGHLRDRLQQAKNCLSQLNGSDGQITEHLRDRYDAIVSGLAKLDNMAPDELQRLADSIFGYFVGITQGP